MDLSVVIPVFNEQKNLQLLYRKLLETLEKSPIDAWEVWMIDDGSTDHSKEIIVDLHEQDPRIRGIFFEHNQGQTAAMNAGFIASRYPFILTLDADLQNDPADLSLLTEKIGPEVGVV